MAGGWFMHTCGFGWHLLVTHTGTSSSTPPQLNIGEFAHMQSNGVVDGTEDWERKKENKNWIIAAHTLHCVSILLVCFLHCTIEYTIPLFSLHSPVPTITWRKINGNIPKKARLRKSQAVLEIPNIQLEDSGTYECKAENPRGGTAFKGHLQVYSESEHTHILCVFVHFLLGSAIKHYVRAQVLMCCIPGISHSSQGFFTI